MQPIRKVNPAVTALIVIVLIAVVVVIATLLSSSDSDSDTPESVATPTSVPPEASTPSSTAPSATTEPETDAPTGSSTGNVSLDNAFVLGTSSPAIWKVTYGDGWEITTLDQEGVTVQTNAALNCTFTTVQNRQVPVNLPLTNDREDTELTVQALQQSFLSQAPDAVITNTPGLAIPYGEFGIYEADVEFAGFRADYVRADNGELWSSMFVTRTMPQIEGMMYSVLNCNKDTIDADETLWRGMLDKTLVASGDLLERHHDLQVGVLPYPLRDRRHQIHRTLLAGGCRHHQFQVTVGQTKRDGVVALAPRFGEAECVAVETGGAREVLRRDKNKRRLHTTLPTLRIR